jgi:membrane protease YdiL (CAAX protease family)
MRQKINILVHAVLFWASYSYAYPFLREYLPLDHITLFDGLNALTGFPTLQSRIAHFVFALLLYVLFAIAWERENWKEAFFLKDSPIGLLRGAAFALLIVVGILVLLQLVGLLDIKGLIPNHEKAAALIFAWFIAQIFNAVQEELVFRGYLLRRLAGQFDKHLSVAIVSLIFGLGHVAQYSLPGFISATLSGAIFGYLYLWYKNIYVPIGMHGTWDICSHVLVNLKILEVQPGPLLSPSALETFSTFPYVVAAYMLFLGVFFVWHRLWRL